LEALHSIVHSFKKNINNLSFTKTFICAPHKVNIPNVLQTILKEWDKIQMTKSQLNFLLPKWKELLEQEFLSSYMNHLRDFLKKEYQSGATVFPKKTEYFKAFSTLDFDNVKVVVLGQDPYHNINQAVGLSFAVPSTMPEPPSLKNIFSEIESDSNLLPNLERFLFSNATQRRTLEHWVNQGVFLLNTVLSVRAHEAYSHRNQGWEMFTDKVIELLGNRQKPIVFLLWGSPAQKKLALIKNPDHLILTAPHPSPLSAHRGFFGCGHFSKTNYFLEKNGLAKIKW
jgi:uracil-DNA glycosylase